MHIWPSVYGNQYCHKCWVQYKSEDYSHGFQNLRAPSSSWKERYTTPVVLSPSGSLESPGELLRTTTVPVSLPRILLLTDLGFSWCPCSFGHRRHAVLRLGTAALCPQLGWEDWCREALQTVYSGVWPLASQVQKLSCQKPRREWSQRDGHMLREEWRGLSVISLIYNEKRTW